MKYPGLRLFLFLLVILTSCQPVKASKSLASEITFYDWENDIPQEILTQFEQEYHVKVNYLNYKSQEQALENLRRGGNYDLVVFDSRFVPVLIRENLLAPLDYEYIPNFRNISPSFRDLAYDPGNMYSIPYNWGTIGLVVREDLIAAPIHSWSDLWDPVHEGKIGVWRNRPRLVIGMALKSLGLSANTENFSELDTSLKHLMQISQGVTFYEDFDSGDITAAFLSGDIVAGIGFGDNYLTAKQEIPSLEYIIPEDGVLLWGDTFVVPNSSQEKPTAQMFLNFLLRPEISGKVVNFNHYATTNLLAKNAIYSEILKEPAIYPPQDKLSKAESIKPVPPAVQEKYDENWKKFIDSSD